MNGAPEAASVMVTCWACGRRVAARHGLYPFHHADVKHARVTNPAWPTDPACIGVSTPILSGSAL